MMRRVLEAIFGPGSNIRRAAMATGNGLPFCAGGRRNSAATRVETMDRSRAAVLANFALRVSYGVAMLAAPGRIGGPWIGRPTPAASSDVPLRGVGGREVALHLTGGSAILRGAPSSPWLLASVGGDLTDIASSLRQRKQLPAGGLRACLLTGGASVLMTLALIAVSE